MRYYTRLKLYKAPNLVFDPIAVEAYSFKFCFVRIIEGMVLFNTYSETSTTNRQQYRVMRLMERLNIQFIAIEYNGSLTDDCIPRMIVEYGYKVEAIRLRINDPKTQKVKNLERMQDIRNLEQTIKVLGSLTDKVS